LFVAVQSSAKSKGSDWPQFRGVNRDEQRADAVGHDDHVVPVLAKKGRDLGQPQHVLVQMLV